MAFCRQTKLSFDYFKNLSGNDILTNCKLIATPDKFFKRSFICIRELDANKMKKKNFRKMTIDFFGKISQTAYTVFTHKFSIKNKVFQSF